MRDLSTIKRELSQAKKIVASLIKERDALLRSQQDERDRKRKARSVETTLKYLVPMRLASLGYSMKQVAEMTGFTYSTMEHQIKCTWRNTHYSHYEKVVLEWGFSPLAGLRRHPPIFHSEIENEARKLVESYDTRLEKESRMQLIKSIRDAPPTSQPASQPCPEHPQASH